MRRGAAETSNSDDILVLDLRTTISGALQQLTQQKLARDEMIRTRSYFHVLDSSWSEFMSYEPPPPYGKQFGLWSG